MTRDEIIRMAEEAGFYFHDAGYAPILHTVAGEYSEACFERFAALVAADERIACAISCEVNAARWVDDMRKNYAAHECAAAIRARSTP